MTEYKCYDCGHKLIHVASYLRGGQLVSGYWRHAEINSCRQNQVSLGESMYHKAAKLLLQRFFNEGGVLTVGRTCKYCDRLKEQTIVLSEGCKAEPEYPFLNSILDLACVNPDNVIDYCIEIKYQHKTSNTKDRDKLLWFELDAEDLLAALADDIDFNDLSRTVLKTRIWLPDVREFVCETTECSTVYSLADLGLKLGYIHDYQRGSDVGLVEVEYYKAWLGRSEVERSFVLFSRVRNNEIAWRKFLEYHKCLSCSANHETSRYKPYCRNCYVDMKTEGDKLVPLSTDCSTKEKSVLRKQFDDILWKIPKCLGQCICCNTNCDGYWWFTYFSYKRTREGYKRALCHTCLETKYTEKR